MADKEMPVKQAQEQGREEPGESGGTIVVLGAMKILYDKATSDGVVKMLTQTGDPMTALVQTTMFVLRLLFDELKGKITPDMLMQDSGQVVSLLAELGTAAGVDMKAVEEKAKQVVSRQLQQKLSQQQAPSTGQDQTMQGQPAQPPQMGAAPPMGGKPRGLINAGMAG